MKTHLAPTESLTVVIDGAEITVTAQQLLGLKQAETTDPDEKYQNLLNQFAPKFYSNFEGRIITTCMDGDQQCVTSELSAQRVRTYIKMLNIAAKLNGEADWNGEGYAIVSDKIRILVIFVNSCHLIKFRTEALALEALTYLNSEDKIAMFGRDKVKED